MNHTSSRAAAPTEASRDTDFGERKAALEIAPALVCVQQPIVNLYFVGEAGAGDRSWVLIDAGLPYSEAHVRAAAARRFGPGSRPAAIILTHGHFDHVGALPALAEFWDAPVYAHVLERPYLSGQSSYPPPDPAVGGGAMSLLSRFYPRGPINLGSRLEELPLDGTVPGMPGWRWVHTPGHTAGHVSLFRDADRVLIAGDAFVTTRQESMLGALLQWRPRVRRPPAYYTTDWEAARASVGILARLEPELAATGHGVPIRGETMRRELRSLAEHWNESARPSRGRYVASPALTDRHGIVHLPPPVIDRQLLVLAALGGAALGLSLAHSRRRSPET
jgi:glyoxylase-like metal-dependent hydrolase (beta-lactamase superfamily II)